MELENVAEIEVELQESGPAGEQGPPGLSAYEVYLVNGGTLSEKEWLESLKGETGTTGADGKDGVDGYTPIKGKDYFTEEDIASLKIPTKTSQLENDSDFTTNAYVDDAIGLLSNSVNEDLSNLEEAIANIDLDNLPKEIYTLNLSGHYDPRNQFNTTDNDRVHISELITLLKDDANVPIYVKTGNGYGMLFIPEYGINSGQQTSYGYQCFKFNNTNIPTHYLCYLGIHGTWDNDVFTCTTAFISTSSKYYLTTDTANSSYTPTNDLHPATKKYVDDSVTTLGDYVDEQLANIDVPDIDLSEYATTSYVDESSVPIYLFTNTDGLANITESAPDFSTILGGAVRDAIQNAYDKGVAKFVIKMYYAKSTVTNFYGRCIELCFTISGTTITLVNRYVMSPYSGGYTRYLVTNCIKVVDGVIKGDSNNKLFIIQYLGDYKDVSGAIVTEDYVNNAVLGAKGSQIYQLNLTDSVSTSGRSLTTAELSAFQTICNEVLASNDNKAQLKLYLKGNKCIGFMEPSFEYTTGTTFYEVIKSSSKKLQGKLVCTRPPGNVSYAFYDATLNITGTYDSTSNSISITKVHAQINANNHVYNVMALSNMILSKSNTTAYTPTGDYHPATKKYVDNAVAAAITTVLEAEY